MIAPPHPRSIASESAAFTFAAGIAITTASTGSGSASKVGTHSRPWTSVRVGCTPQTGPSNPARSRLRSTASAYEPGRSFAPTTATDRGRSRGHGSSDGRRATGDGLVEDALDPTPLKPRATISRWISLVPSQIRSTRSSRSSRSATLERM